MSGRPVEVADLDLRTGAAPTPIVGVIGADVLRPYVLDVSFAPWGPRDPEPRQPCAAVPGRPVPAMNWVAERPV